MILVGDAAETLACTFPDASVQCVVTSPPYFGLRRYSTDGREIGREETEGDYIAALVAVGNQLRRVLTPTGSWWLNIGDSIGTHGWRLMPHRVVLALQSTGWTLQSDVVWAKSKYLPNGGTVRPVAVHESVFLLTPRRRGHYFDADAIREPHSPVSLERWKTGVAKFGGKQSLSPKVAVDGAPIKTRIEANPLGKYRTSVWNLAPSSYRGSHTATMPERLAEMCVLASTRPGDLVIDPFAGSGTTGVVSKRYNRDFIGIELNKEYAALAQERIGATATEVAA